MSDTEPSTPFFQASSTGNMTLDDGGSNELEVYVVLSEDARQKRLTNIVPPTSKQQRGSGPKANKVVDLLRIERRLIITGWIELTDKSKFWNVFNAGGSFSVTFDGDTFDANFEKANMKKSSTNEADEREVMFTLVVGEDI